MGCESQKPIFSPLLFSQSVFFLPKKKLFRVKADDSKAHTLEARTERAKSCREIRLPLSLISFPSLLPSPIGNLLPVSLCLYQLQNAPVSSPLTEKMFSPTQDLLCLSTRALCGQLKSLDFSFRAHCRFRASQIGSPPCFARHFPDAGSWREGEREGGRVTVRER